jgi:hypothetical protein
MNSVVGGLVYAASEVTVQYKNSNEDTVNILEKFDCKRVTKIGVLGSLENGVLMTGWYGTI